jgi:hypothetical protein
MAKLGCANRAQVAAIVVTCTVSIGERKADAFSQTAR